MENILENLRCKRPSTKVIAL